MTQNVEYPTVPLNNNVKFWQHFWAENILKVPMKGKISDNNFAIFLLRENTS